MLVPHWRARAAAREGRTRSPPSLAPTSGALMARARAVETGGPVRVWPGGWTGGEGGVGGRGGMDAIAVLVLCPRPLHRPPQREHRWSVRDVRHWCRCPFTSATAPNARRTRVRRSGSSAAALRSGRLADEEPEHGREDTQASASGKRIGCAAEKGVHTLRALGRHMDALERADEVVRECAADAGVPEAVQREARLQRVVPRHLADGLHAPRCCEPRGWAAHWVPPPFRLRTWSW